MSTYDDFKNFEASEKNALVKLEFAKRLMGWVVHSGSVYKLTSFDFPVIVTIEEDGTALSEVSSLASVTPGTFYNDRVAKTLYLETTGSVDPNSVFIAFTSYLFFSRAGINAPNDLATGVTVEWLPLIQATTAFGTGLDNQNQFGNAIEGSGSVTFVNDGSFWKQRYDKLTFENKRCFVYSWNRTLPITEAKLLYRGKVTKKNWNSRTVRFSLKDQLNELRQPIPLNLMEDVSNIRIPDDLQKALQRRIYGVVNGNLPINIDQQLDGYPLTGTATVTGTSVTGIGSAFLAECSPEDELIFTDPTGGVQDAVAIESVDSDTSITLSESIGIDVGTAGAVLIEPNVSKPYINREWFVAGHALREPTTTVSVSTSARVFTVADSTDFLAGDEITVGSEIAFIEEVSTSGRIKVDRNLTVPPPVSTVVKRLTITDVRINEKRLQFTRDYTYSATTGRLTLESDAEFNIAKVRTLTGTNVTFTSTSRDVSGTSTVFTQQLKPGDYVRARGNSDFYEILQVVDDTNLVLRTASTYTDTDISEFKSVNNFDPEDAEDVLSISVIGKTKDGLSSGAFIETGPEIIFDLLTEAGLSADIDTASFTTGNDLAPCRLGVAIPKGFSGTDAPSVRDIIDDVNRSIFGSLVLDNDLLLQFNPLRPTRVSSMRRLFEHDLVNWQISSQVKNIIKRAEVRYDIKEFDFLSRDSAFSTQSKISDTAQYLSKTANEKIIETLLVDEDDARIFANRWAFILEVASSVIKIQTKMQLSDSQVSDTLDVTHQKFYERLGSSGNRKIGLIQKITKSYDGVSVELEDLANAFTRCSTITENDADSYENSNEDGIFLHGFVTRNDGMQNLTGTSNPDADTFGVNLIF